jgi:chromosome segregation ATPase
VRAIPLILAALVAAGCTLRPTPAVVMPATADQQAISAHLDELERKISGLEGRLNHSQGALRHGSNLLVDGGGQESVLERLRRLDRELAASRAVAADQEKHIAALRGQLTAAHGRGDELAGQADALGHVRDSLVNAQQELAERKTIIASLNEQLAVCELQRLRAEKAYYQLAASVLKLAPGQTQELADLQDLVRIQVKDVRMKSGETRTTDEGIRR